MEVKWVGSTSVLTQRTRQTGFLVTRAFQVPMQTEQYGKWFATNALTGEQTPLSLSAKAILTRRHHAHHTTVRTGVMGFTSRQNVLEKRDPMEEIIQFVMLAQSARFRGSELCEQFGIRPDEVTQESFHFFPPMTTFVIPTVSC